MKNFGSRNVKAKGEAGHIGFLKKKELCVAALTFLFSAALFATGLILNNGDKANIWTIAAAVGVIPMARALTGFILVCPFRDVSAELIKRVEDTAKPGSLVYTDVIVTSTEKAMGLAFIVITGTKVIILTGRAKQDLFKINEYLGGLVRRKGFDFKVTVTDEEEKFFSLLRASDSVADRSFESEAEQEAFEQQRRELCEAFEVIML